MPKSQLPGIVIAPSVDIMPTIDSAPKEPPNRQIHKRIGLFDFHRTHELPERPRSPQKEFTFVIQSSRMIPTINFYDVFVLECFEKGGLAFGIFAPCA